MRIFLFLALCIFFLSIPGQSSNFSSENESSLEIPENLTRYRSQVFYIEPYQIMSIDDIRTLIKTTTHEIPEDFLPLPFSCYVDDHWRIACDLYQELIRRSDVNHYFFDNKFTVKSMIVKGTRNDFKTGLIKEEYLYNMNTLFFYWKQIAWIDPTEAESLSQALSCGFVDKSPVVYVGKIPINQQWSHYWKERARLLSSSHEWYYPKDNSGF